MQKALIHGEPQRLAVHQLLPDALEDQHVGIHGDADGQHETGHARQRECEAECGKSGEREQAVERECRDRERARYPVVTDHDHDHEQHTDDPREHPVVDGIGTQACADRALVDDREGRGQGSGPQHERQITRFLERLAAELDLAVRPDLVLNDRRLSLHAAVENDRHEVVDMASRFLREDASAAAAELECDDRLIGDLISAGHRFGQLFAGDDGSRFHGIQGTIGARAARFGLRAPAQLDAARDLCPDVGPLNETVDERPLLLGNEEFPRQLTLE